MASVPENDLFHTMRNTATNGTSAIDRALTCHTLGDTDNVRFVLSSPEERSHDVLCAPVPRKERPLAKRSPCVKRRKAS